MKQYISNLFTQALTELKNQNIIPETVNVSIERTRDKNHGDFACNAALILAKTAAMPPRALAEKIIKQLNNNNPAIKKFEIAGPGFINVFLTPQAYSKVITDILENKDKYGHSNIGAGQSVMIEFVSANPTGPLHVGHGRGAAYGAALANLLSAVSYKVHKEYYINDAGRQMDILAISVWLRYLELAGETLNFPANAYQGDYIWDIAASLHREQGDKWRHTSSVVFDNLPDIADKELHIDGLIQRCQQLLGESEYKIIFQRALDVITENIRLDLEQFGVVYDQWFPESRLTSCIDRLAEHTYKKDGALWFKSTTFGDEKDRVLVRDNGQFTYFASDVAYHLNKFERNFDKIINIWGADHHGYVARVKAAITALGMDAERLKVLLVQFAALYRGKERLKMSTRSGEFVTLRELRQEVGTDAARFFYIQRKSEQHLNFDLELAKSQSNENPIYYIQYAHARISSVFRKLDNIKYENANLELLSNKHEQALFVTLSRYPEMIENAAAVYEPHQITYYLRELAQQFHTFYDANKILIDDQDDLRNARLSLIAAIQQVLRNGLTIIGVKAPEVM
ncbi:arginine--tRNA ligase [Candidatus Marithrix sp. Canyon 246]|uniref:arginine--tRNA ligase n=1 Tax=Candidatus Marithrix sp. Canyon 246 TaxID=1827136 RepID=UPI000849FF97|nr:arginine--tRNA ligase [Candidatus Marithrix sp. Canyon 246]